MNLKSLLASPWVRIIVFAWMFIFPLAFIALPMAEAYFGETEQSWTPVWALIIWLLAPYAASIVVKYVGGEANEEKEN